MSRIDLEHVREWANAKLSSSQESQGAVPRHMKLRETVDAALAKMDGISASIPREKRRVGKRISDWCRQSETQAV